MKHLIKYNENKSNESILNRYVNSIEETKNLKSKIHDKIFDILIKYHENLFSFENFEKDEYAINFSLKENIYIDIMLMGGYYEEYTMTFKEFEDPEVYNDSKRFGL